MSNRRIDWRLSMKSGKVSEAILKRSVFNNIKKRRPEVIKGSTVGGDCGILKLNSDMLVMTTDPVTGTIKNVGEYGIYKVVNDLAAAGAETVAVTVSVLMPENFTEKKLKDIMSTLDSVCQEQNVEIIGGHTEVTKIVNSPLVTVTGIGRPIGKELVSIANAKPGQDIVMTKWIGIEGNRILATQKRDDILKKYREEVLIKAKGERIDMSVQKEARIALEAGVKAMHDVSEGGIFAALWDLSEAAEVGLRVDFKAIPVRQEGIEICEMYDINPYMLSSTGALLMVTDDGYGLAAKLNEAGIMATVIGQTTDNNDKLIINGEEIRYLDPPQRDEIHKIKEM